VQALENLNSNSLFSSEERQQLATRHYITQQASVINRLQTEVTHLRKSLYQSSKTEKNVNKSRAPLSRSRTVSTPTAPWMREKPAEQAQKGTALTDEMEALLVQLQNIST
ncbi:MAG: hypothetical protein JSR46_06465, partial [Verrucomicrobia bacterium]|nr:hypothetical protein [Verrucomicrobiota bacterium]